MRVRLATSVLALVLVLVLAVGVAACGGDGDDKVATPKGPTDQAKARAIVLKASDLPPGWRSEPTGSGEETTEQDFSAFASEKALPCVIERFEAQAKRQTEATFGPARPSASTSPNWATPPAPSGSTRSPWPATSRSRSTSILSWSGRVGSG